MKISTTLLASAGLVAAQNATNINACTAGVHFIVARGSSEDPGTGKIGWIAGNASQQIPDSTTFPISYPATFDDYLNSEAEGRGNMTNAIEDYIKQCPSNKIALLGWSQGAQAIMDTLCGTSEQYFTTSAALSSSYVDSVIAVVLYGDPSHVPGQPWDLGTSNKSGIFPRADNLACAPYGRKIKSYCDANDKYCDAGNSSTVHSSYFAKYDTEAVNFIVSQWKAAKANGSASTTTSASPTGSSSAVATASRAAAAELSTGQGLALSVAGLSGLIALLL